MASTEFELRLAEAGYAACDEYEHAWFRVTECRYYRVHDDFPRIVRAGLPPAVVAASYEIDLHQCAAFECEF